MNISQLRKRIIRYYRNQASAAERYIIDQWYESFDRDKRDTPWPVDRKRVNALEDRIIQQVLDQRGTHRWYQSTWTKMAASVLLIATASLSIYFASRKHDQSGNAAAEPQVYTAKPGQLKQLILPDSTVVTLNANSTFKVLPGYGEKERLVELAGEAFFEVTSNAHRPFRVHTAELDIRVVGTSFNVRSYTRLNHAEVTVSSGRVAVANEGRTLAMLHAHQQLIYDKLSGKYTSDRISPAEKPAWIGGTIVLNQADFNELAQAIHNIYSLEISSTDPAILRKKYNLTIRATRAYEQTLQQLCAITGTRYRKEGKDGIVIY